MAAMTMAQVEEKLRYILKGHEKIVAQLKRVSDPVTKLEDMEQLVMALQLTLGIVGAKVIEEQAEADVQARVVTQVRCPKCKSTDGLQRSWDAWEQAMILGVDEHGDEVFSTLMDTQSFDDSRIDCTECDAEDIDWDEVESVDDEEDEAPDDAGRTFGADGVVKTDWNEVERRAEAGEDVNQIVAEMEAKAKPASNDDPMDILGGELGRKMLNPEWKLYECGTCDGLHPWMFNGDCRDAERYRDAEDFANEKSIAIDLVKVASWEDRQKADEAK